MNDRTRLLLIIPCLALLALLAVLAITFIGSSGASASCAMPNPPASGDWIINANEVCTPTAGPWTVNGNIEVKANGNLTLTGVRVQMASTSPGQRTIFVRTGGTFNIFSSSTITATNSADHYKFLVEKGAHVIVSSSTIEYCGYDNTPDDALGMRILSDTVTITKSTFRLSYTGVYVEDSSPNIDNSTFQQDVFGIVVSGSTAKPTIYDNHVLNNQEGVIIYYATPTVGNNEVGWSADTGIDLLASNANIFGNDIHNNSFGIYFQSSSLTIKGNTIRGDKDGIRGFFGNPLIKGNNLHDATRNLIWLSNTGGSVEGNTIRGLNDLWSTTNGVYLVTSTTQVKDNKFYQIGMYGVALTINSVGTVTGNMMDNPEIGVYVKGSTVKMEHNTITNASVGVSLDGAQGSIKYNSITLGWGSSMGIDTYYVNETMVIEQNTINNQWIGIHLYSAHPLIKGDNFTANEIGMKIYDSHPRILFSNFTANPIGLFIDQDANVYAEGNHLTMGNKTIFLSRSQATLVNNNIDFSANWSIELTNNSYIRMIGNKISGNDRYGVWFVKSSGWLTNNTFTGSDAGVYAWMSKLTLDHNNFSKNTDGLYLDTTPATLVGDIFRNCSQQGIMAHGSNIKVDSVQMYDNNESLYVFGGSADVKNSTFVHNYIGMWFWQDPHVSITGGRVSWSTQDSIKLETLGTVTISGLIVSNNTGKFEISTPTVDMSSLTYTGNKAGIDANLVTLNIADSNFKTNNDTAIRLLNSHVVILNTTLDDNLLGIDIETSTLDIRSSNILNSNQTGIQSQGSTISVRDTRIIRNKDGIFEMGDSYFNIYNCNISSNQVFGIYTTDKTKSFIINYTRKIINEDNIFMVHGPMVIADGGQLFLLRSNLEFWSDTPGDSGLTVKKGGQLTMRENVVYAYTHDIGYYFIAESGSFLSISNSTFRNAGRGMTGPNTGLLVKTDKAYLNDLFFEDNQVGLHVNSAIIQAFRLRFNANTDGVLVEDGEVDLTSSDFNASTDKDIILMRSTGKLLDTKFLIDKVDIHDANSLLIVMWYLTVQVVWNDGQPVSGALVNITDKSNVKLMAHTDAQGNTPKFVVREYQQKGPDSVNRVYLTPHDIKGTINHLTVDKSVNIQSSTTIKIVMNDDKPPDLKVTSPVAGEVMYNSSILFAGTAYDEGSSVASVELSLDGKNWFTANGTSTWTGYMTMPDGIDVVKIRATDMRGNSLILTYTVEVDLTSPLLQIYHPSDGSITNQTKVTVTGKVHQGSQLVINNQPVKVDNNGTFTYILTLSEGQNQVHAKASAKGGTSSMEKIIVVTRDTAPPTIKLSYPTPGSYVNKTSVTVTVSSNEEVSFFINGQPVSTFGGKADGIVELKEGKNDITVKAQDLAGNWNTFQFNVTRDTIKPDLVLTKPTTAVLSTTNDKLEIVGTTEVGANLTLDKKPLTLGPGGTFKITKKLKEGKTSFTLTSTDKAGNSNVMVLDVTRKHVTNYTPYYILMVVLAIIGVAGDIGTLIYFKKYYNPKGPETKDGEELSDEETEEKELMEGLEGEEGWDAPKDGQRRYPRRPKPPEKETGETEFETVDDLGEF